MVGVVLSELIVIFVIVFSRIMMKKILFLHGFFASGGCAMAGALREAFAGRAEVLTPDLPLHPGEALVRHSPHHRCRAARFAHWQ